ncbi:Uncharacterised protein [Mycobacteroides abscessus subsp. abscessus]|nr:Uncharacterised protein [Mycobacteroides abscessus subsp. abscessus]
MMRALVLPATSTSAPCSRTAAPRDQPTRTSEVAPAKRRNQPEPRMVTLRLSKVLANTEVEMPCDFIAFTIGPSSV